MSLFANLSMSPVANVSLGWLSRSKCSQPTIEERAITAVGANIVDQGTHCVVADDIRLDLDHQVGPVFPDGVADAPPRQVADPQRQFSETLVGKVEGVEWSAIDLVHGFGTGIAATGITGDGASFRPLPTVSDSAR